MAKSKKKKTTKSPAPSGHRRVPALPKQPVKSKVPAKPKRKKSYLERNKTRGYKLEPKDQLFVCSLIATGYTAPVIVDMLFEQRGIKMSPKNVLSNYKYNRKWRKVIARMRSYLERKVMEHPLASKRNRLDMRLRAINEAFMPRVTNINYEPFTGKIKSKIIKRSVHLVEPLLQGAMEEFMGKKALFEQHTHHTHIYLPEIDKPNEHTGRTGHSRMASAT